MFQISRFCFVFVYAFILLIYFSFTSFGQNGIVFPKNNSIINHSSINIVWNKVNSATSYELQVSTNNLFSGSVLAFTTTSNNYNVNGLTLGNDYYIRVRGKINNAKTEWFPPVKISYFLPSVLSNQRLWLSADTGVVISGGAVRSWKDLSSSSNNAIQNNDVNMPLLLSSEPSINNKPYIKLDGVDDFLEFNEIANLRSAFLVAKHTTGNQNYAAIMGHNTELQFTGGVGDELLFSENNPSVVSGKVYINNTLAQFFAPKKPSQFTLITFITNGNAKVDHLASDRKVSGRYWNGNYAEVIIYSTPLEDSDRLKVQNYIYNKYAPGISIKDTVIGSSFCSTALLSAPSNFTRYRWSNGDTTSITTVRTNNTYSLTATDIFGNESTQIFNVFPYVRLNNTTIYVCYGDTLKIDLKTPVGYSALWNNGVNSTKINISETGKYIVKVTDGQNCSTWDTVNVLFDNPSLSPTPNTSNSLTMCTNEKLFLTSSTPYDSIHWSTGSTDNFISVTNSGNYSVYGRTVASCIINKSLSINIAGDAPTANFDVTTACQNAPIYFTDASVIPPGNTTQTRRWTFSNNTTATIPNPVNVFSTPGIATASLKITTNVGCTDSIFKTFTVNRNPEPYFYNLLSCEGNATTFVDQSIANAASISDWRWSFDDLGVINSIQNPSFTFNSPGEYNIKLVATNSNNCSDSVTLPTTVYPSPVSNFSFDSVCGRSPLSLRYLATVAPPSTLTAWSWEFGDGTFENAIQNPQKVYNTPGIYTVKLAVRSSNQCVDTVEKQVKVFDFPVVDFDVSQSQCVGKEIQFTDISSTPDGTPVNAWKWFFSGQTTSVEQNPRYTFNVQGNYVVQLTATNSVGCTGTKLRSIAISSLPEPKFNFTPANVMPGETVSYSNQSPSGGSYIWDYGDASPLVNTYNPPAHSYSALGTYPITLIATDFRGCTDSLTKYILVGKAYLDGVMASINFTPNGDFYKVQVTIVNNSNIEITSLGLSLLLSGGGLVRENWTGSLMPGKSVVYSFTAEIKVDDSAVPVICASIDNINNNAREDKLDNNSTCKETRVGQFDVLNIYPNPAYETVNFGVMLPQDGKVSIRLIDILGKVLYTTDFNGVKGYNNLPVNTGYLNAAVYVAEVYYDGEIIRKKFARKDRR